MTFQLNYFYLDYSILIMKYKLSQKQISLKKKM